MFGYEAGAFTGATHAKPGKFELCNKGTILLDEIGEMPPILQAKLLHVLQDQQFSRLGGRSGDQGGRAHSGRDQHQHSRGPGGQAAARGSLLPVERVHPQLPPLRERKEEIPILLKHFMAHMAERYARRAVAAFPDLCASMPRVSWPGNLRELNNFVKRYLVLGDEKLAIHELHPQATTSTAA